ncbi:PQQ-binding-like beta-propeller repeat protein [Williamsia sp.]|uniref:outer membrane protein assembly factor BamB family protein n=1 Tax=Williamsia sp. TaxID=1872085 RepID=UPI001A27FC48|nr:PQQ-binding-like beta-propeller repeat protein [Williamsia sp.]MBJ7291513.1 PQQ-binding-like beta-propeller repeat protein [Williamsia sp.]
MPSLSVNSKRGLVIVLVAMTAIASAAITWKVGHDYDRRREADRMRSLGFGVRPTPLWTLDVKRLTDQPGEVLRTIPSLDNGNGYGTLVDSSTHLIAALGQPRTYGGADITSDVTLVGLDRTQGSTVWKRPLGPVRQCSEGPVTDAIACWSDRRVIIVDTATGRVRSETTPGFDVSGVSIIDGTTFINGSRGQGPSTTVVIQAGTADKPMSSFTRLVPNAGTSASVTELVPSRNLFIVGGLGDPYSMSTVYALDTGTRRFAVNGSLRPIGVDLFRAESLDRYTEQLMDDNGTTLQNQRLSLAGGSFQPQVLATPFAPVVMGDGVFDPTSGALLWRDPVLDWGRPVGGVTPAIVGDVLVAGSLDGNLIGIDTRTGRRVWTTPWRNSFTARIGITDGRYLVFGDLSGMHSLDTVTGRIVWSVESPGTDVDRYTYVSGARGDIVRSAKDSISVWRARTGPDPA